LTFRGGTVKKIVLALAVAVATAAAANAQTAAAKPAPKASQTKAAPAAKMPAAKAHTTKAEVVSTDAAAKTITIKDASGADMTLTATGPAVGSLSKVKAGDWVMVTHTDTSASKRSRTAMRFTRVSWNSSYRSKRTVGPARTAGICSERRG